MARADIGIRAIWAVVGIIVSIVIFSFVGSLTWLFSAEIITLFEYLAIVIATVSVLILL